THASRQTWRRNGIIAPLAFGQSNQEFLCVECVRGRWLTAMFASWCSPSAQVAPVALQQSCFHVVCQIGFEYLMANSVANDRVFQRKYDFDAFVQITRHPISTADRKSV